MVIPHTELETLAHFGIDPDALEPGPDDLVNAPGWRERVAVSSSRKPCSACGAPAMSTRLVPLAGFGPRWVDSCRDCMIAASDYRVGCERQ